MNKDEDVIFDIEDASFKVRTMDGGYETFAVGDIFSIDENDITTEFIRQAPLYGFFATTAAVAEDIAARASFKKDQEYARTDEAARHSLEQNGQKYTEAVIRGIVLMDDDYQKSVNREMKTQYDHKLLKAIVRALEQRAEMLVSLGSHIRHEASMTGMTIRDREIENVEKDVKATLKSHKQNSQ